MLMRLKGAEVKEAIIEWLHQRGVDATPEQIRGHLVAAGDGMTNVEIEVCDVTLPVTAAGPYR